MVSDFPLFPEQASTVAPLVDNLYLFLVVVTGGVSLLIWLVIFYFAIKYRRRPDNEMAQEQEPPAALEVTWIVIPTIIFLATHESRTLSLLMLDYIAEANQEKAAVLGVFMVFLIFALLLVGKMLGFRRPSVS